MNMGVGVELGCALVLEVSCARIFSTKVSRAMFIGAFEFMFMPGIWPMSVAGFSFTPPCFCDRSPLISWVEDESGTRVQRIAT